MNKFLFFLFAVFSVSLMTSCTEVENGERGVAYKPYNGGLDPDFVYGEGVDVGISWLWNEMITYNIRQQSLDMDMVLMDKEGLDVDISVTLLYRVIPNRIGFLHEEKGQDYQDSYVLPIAQSACKKIVAGFGAIELNVSKRDSAEILIKETISNIFAENNHLQVDNVMIKDVDLPDKIANAIIAKKEQDERNLLAEKKKLEEENLAQAAIAKAKGEYEAAEYTAKTKEILSQPKMLELKKLEIQELWAKKGVSPYGSNNVFGSGTGILLNRN